MNVTAVEGMRQSVTWITYEGFNYSFFSEYLNHGLAGGQCADLDARLVYIRDEAENNWVHSNR